MGHILKTHTLPTDAGGPLFGDDFDTFCAWREGELLKAIAEVTGWDVDATPTTAAEK